MFQFAARHVALVSFTFSIATLVGCSDGDDAARIEQQSKRIIAGQVDNDDPAVVAVLAFDALGARGTCTGEVISDRVVLTAAHCVSSSGTFYPIRFAVATGTDIRSTEGTTAAKAVAHPSYDPNSGVNDVAVVLMSQSLGITPLAYNKESLAGKDGTPIRIVGYGMTIDGDSSAVGVKNAADTAISDTNDQTFLAASLPASQCHGDSGGPALMNNVIIGLGWRTVRTDGKCDQGVRDTRVDIHADWIAQQVQQLEQGGGGTAPGGGGNADPFGGGGGGNFDPFNGNNPFGANWSPFGGQ